MVGVGGVEELGELGSWELGEIGKLGSFLELGSWGAEEALGNS
jgi:hypothetical protein